MDTYRYLKKCRVCEEIYYNKEITLDQFLHIRDNPHITVGYRPMDTGIESTAVIESLCSDCNREQESKLA